MMITIMVLSTLINNLVPVKLQWTSKSDETSHRITIKFSIDSY